MRLEVELKTRFKTEFKMKEWMFKYRKLLAAVAVVFVLMASGWYFVATKAVKVLQDTLIARVNQEINGRLQVGSMSLSFSGKVQIRDVTLFDAKEAKLAQIPLVQLSYRMTNLMDGNLDISRIETVSLHDVQLWLQKEKDVWNWENVIKESKSAAEAKDGEPPAKAADGGAKFMGKMEIKDGRAYLKTDDFSREMSDINGEAVFKAYPDLALNFQGKTGTALLKVNGTWGEKSTGEVVISSDEIDLTQFKDMISATEDIKLEGGKLKGVAVNIKQSAGGDAKLNARGELTGLKVAGKINIDDGKGKFSGNTEEIQFSDLACLVSGQQVSGQGKVAFKKEAAILDFDIAIPDLDPSKFLSGINVNRPMALKLRVTGPATSPAATGAVSIAGITADDMVISGISGSISYADDRLVLNNMKGSAYQGALSAQGVVLPENKSYELDLSGSNMDSSKLTDKDVQGPLDFTGHLSGRNEAIITKGNFVIKDGKAYGLPFKTLTGKFNKHGDKTDITDIAINTALGTIYPEQLSKEALEKARERLGGASIPMTKEEIGKTLVDKLKERMTR